MPGSIYSWPLARAWIEGQFADVVITSGPVSRTMHVSSILEPVIEGFQAKA